MCAFTLNTGTLKLRVQAYLSRLCKKLQDVAKGTPAKWIRAFTSPLPRTC